jgi:two-component system, LuxR family, response regulator FixJ
MDHESIVYVVDDDAAARAAVAALVRSKGLEAKEFSSAEEFLSQFSPTMKGCIVVDIRMAGMSGLEMLQKLQSPKGVPPVLVVTTNADIPLAVMAMREGAIAFLEKPGQDEDLWNAIVHALEVEETQYTQRRQLAEAHDRLESLSEDELEVFRRLLAGHANKRIAADLDIGLRTVELRRSNIMKKMQATSLPDLVRLAILAGFFKAGCCSAEAENAVSS